VLRVTSPSGARPEWSRRVELARLPLWTGDRHGLTRTIVLPPDDLDRVLQA